MSERVTHLVVQWDDEQYPDGVDGDEWAYTLRMGGIDADEVTVISDDDDRHKAIPQAGCNVCVCGSLVDDTTAHWTVAAGGSDTGARETGEPT